MIQRFTKNQFLKNKSINCTIETITWERIEAHWHEYFEIEYIVSGTGDYIIDNRKYHFRPGSLFFMSPINIHHLVPNKAKIINISFTENACNPQLLSHFDFINQTFNINLDKSGMAFYETISHELHDNLNDDKYCRQILNCIINKILKCSNKNVYQASGYSPVKKTIIYILSKFKNNITLNEAASYAGLTPSYFSMLFKKETGMKFKNYIDNLRFEQARKLIHTSDVDLQQICIESGFKNYENFSRRFKQKFGITPNEYMKKSEKYHQEYQTQS